MHVFKNQVSQNHGNLNENLIIRIDFNSIKIRLSFLAVLFGGKGVNKQLKC